MKFAELVDVPQLEKTLEILHRAVGVPVGILDPGGDIIGATGWQDLCMKFHRVNPKTRQRCRESDAYFQARMKEGSLLSFKCRNGLWDTAFPIKVEDAHLVTLSLGQIFFEDDPPDLEYFRKQAREFGFDPELYLAAVRRVPILSRQKVGEVMDCAVHIVRPLLQVGLKSHRLERELNQRRAAEDSLRETRASAEVANLVKGQFISTLSREIRTPMNGVIGVSELLLDTELTLEQRDLVETLKAGSDALLVVVDEILDFSTMETGKLELEPIEFNLREVIEDLGEMIAHRAQDKGLEYVSLIAPEVPEFVCGDARRLRQLLIHLLGNAVKFTPAGEVVLQVSAERLEDGRRQVRFTITDTGVGIPPERLENVFQAFSERADANFSSHVPGVGLGLAICRRLVDLMDGKIGVISLAGKGSTFWFNIRLDPVAPGERPRESAEALAECLRNRKVLIVDDHPLNCSLLRQYCKHWDIACEDVSGAVPALQRLREAAWGKKPFALALIDLQMPGMSGEALVGQICDDPLLRGLPLVVMTDFGKRGEAALQTQGKVAAFLPKPVRRAQLQRCLEVAVGCRAPDAGNIAPAAPRPAVSSERRRQYRILLAEDNPMNRKVILKTLTHLGYQAFAVENGKQLLEKLRTEPCDLLLLDLQMPEMNGIEAAREIRRLETDERRLPIVALTAYAMDEDREKVFQVGMDEFLVKPIVPNLLAKVLERFLGGMAPAQSVIGQIRVSDAREAVPPDSPEAVFHRRRLLERMNGDDRRMREMAGSFIAGFPTSIARVRGAWLEKRFDDAIRQVQVLRGGSFDLEAARLEERLRCLETVLRDGEIQRIEEQFDLLNTDFAEFRAVVGECPPAAATSQS